MKRAVPIFLLLIACAGCPAPRVEHAQPAPDPWALLGSYEFPSAARGFAQQLNTEPGNREARLGLALATLNVPPKSARRLDEAERLLQDLVREDDSDNAGLLARYHLGRIAQLHRPQPDFQHARRIFEDLASAAPTTLIGELALLKAACIDLYAAPDPTTPAELRLATWAARVPDLQHDVVRRNFTRMLSDAAMHHLHDDEEALAWTLETITHAFARDDIQQAYMLRAQNLAVREGRYAEACAIIRDFIDTAPRALWKNHLEQRLRDLGCEPATEGATP